MNEGAIKLLDRCVGGPLVSVFGRFKPGARPYRTCDIARAQRFLIIRPGGIGDAALLVPLLKELQRLGKTVDVLAMRRNAGLFAVLARQKLVGEVAELGSLAAIARCRKRKYDVVLDTEQSFYLSAVIAALVRPGMVIGFDTNERRRFYDHFVQYRQEEYEAQSFLNLLRPFHLRMGVTAESLRMDALPLPEGIDPRGSNLVLSAGAAMEARRIPGDFFRALLQARAGRFSHIWMVGGANEAAQADRIIDGTPNATNLCGRTSLAETLAVLQRAEVFVGSDSGPLHMAVIAGVPRIIGVFGPGLDSKWARPDLVSVVANRELVCRPCNYGRFSQTPPCPYGYECLRDLRLEDILEAMDGEPHPPQHNLL